MMNFNEADIKLGKRDTKKVGNNTYLVRLTEDTIGVKLHNTCVVEINRDGTYRLNSGGWQTVTTKARINEFAPVRLSQHDYRWFVNGQHFYDGIIV